MPPKRTNVQAAPAASVSSGASTPRSSSAATPKSKPASASASTPAQTRMADKIWGYYLRTTSSRTKLIDIFMIFLVAVGAIQFLYCVLAGNYPFNAFLSGFCATVGQFVLAASLRIQTQDANKKDFPDVSPERAFADFVVCSLILHFFCINFIN